MIELLKVISLIIYTIFLSFLAGELVLNKLKLSDRFVFATPIGFYVFLGLYQLLIYPVQYFHLKGIYLVYSLFIISLLILGWAIKNYEVFLKKRFNLKKIILILFVTSICTILYYFTSNVELICDSYALTSADNDLYFYIRMISENSKLSMGVNSTDIINGNQLISVSSLYAFTGIIHMFSAMTVIFNLRSITLVFWFCFIILRIFTLMNMFNIEKLLNINKYLKNIYKITVIFSLFIGFGFVSGFYPVNFRWFTGMTSILIFCLINYFKENNDKWIFLYCILTLGLLASQSTQLFISAALFVVAAVYDSVINKKFNVRILSIISFPVLLYSAFFIAYSMNEHLIMMIFLILFMLINILSKFFPKLFDYRIVLLSGITALIVMILYGFVGKGATFSFLESIDYFSKYTSCLFFDSEFVKSPFDILGNIGQRLLFLCPFISIFNFKKNNIEMNICSIFMITTILLFYNPLVMPFVSTFMTGIVYHRLELLIINSVYYFIFLNVLDEKKVYFNKMLLISVLLSSVTLCKDVVGYLSHYDEYSLNAEPKYKISNDVIEISDFLDDYFYDQEITVLYPITIANLRLYNECFQTSTLVPYWYQNSFYHDDFIYKYDELDDLMKIQCMMELPIDYFTNYYYEFEPERVPDLKQILLESDADIVIMKKWADPEGEDRIYHELLSQFTEIIYDNDTYQIYRIYR